MQGQSELDQMVQKAAEKKAAKGGVMSDDERRKLVGTEQSLDMPAQSKIPSAIEGLEEFTLGVENQEDTEDTSAENQFIDADSFFNLPNADNKKDIPEK